MFTLGIGYTIDSKKLQIETYVEAEQGPILRCGKAVQFFLPTDFAGPTNEGIGLIDFSNFSDYEIVWQMTQITSATLPRSRKAAQSLR